jgi:hypothetical protein
VSHVEGRPSSGIRAAFRNLEAACLARAGAFSGFVVLTTARVAPFDGAPQSIPTVVVID